MCKRVSVYIVCRDVAGERTVEKGVSLEYKSPKLRPSIAMDQLKNRRLGSVKRERRSEDHTGHV